MSGMNPISIQAGAQQSWLKRHDPNPSARLRLVCFPFAGAGANAYRQWPRYIDKRIEVIGVQLPGREARMREPNAVSADTIVSGILHELMRYCPHQPLAIFGHSMGSMLAYELAWRLKTHHGWEPRALVVSGRLPPHVVFGGDLHQRSDEALIEAIKRLNGTPPGIFEDEEMRRIFLPVIRSDYQVVETYRVPPNGWLTCPLAVCTSTDDADAPPDEMTQWRTVTKGPFSRWDFTGDHFFLREQAAGIASVLNPYLMSMAEARSHERHERAY